MQLKWKTKTSFFELLEKIIILVAHLVLLKWILFVLANSGTFDSIKIFLHFLGLATYGSLLIWGTSFIVRKRYERTIARKN